MTITIKLFAHLSKYLPENAERNIATLELPEGTTVSDVIELLKVPPEECHLVLINGLYIYPDARNSNRLEDGQTLAIWPLVAGG